VVESAAKEPPHAGPVAATSWTGTVAALAEVRGASLGTVSFDGPYGGNNGVLCCPVTVMVVGGVGITPMLSALAELARDPEPRVAVLVVWCIRTIELVKLVFGELAVILEDPRVRMEIHLTRGGELDIIDRCVRNVCATGRARFEIGRPNLGSVVSTFLECGIRATPQPQGIVSIMLCGPDSLVKDARRQVPVAASRLGWSVEIHAEEFEL
jgi:predicted ferric reductase